VMAPLILDDPMDESEVKAAEPEEVDGGDD
jgi:hypothetical protein